MTTTDTPRTDAAFGQGRHGAMKIPYETSCQLERELNEARQWLDERYKALSEADERAERAEAENVCLQELIQEFYEWSRRDFPTEQEVREIMNRYYDLLNK